MRMRELARGIVALYAKKKQIKYPRQSYVLGGQPARQKGIGGFENGVLDHVRDLQMVECKGGRPPWPSS